MKQTIIAAAFCLLLFACQEDDTQNIETLSQLHKEYKDGGISECMLEGEIVYSASINAYDAGSYLYNSDGTQIGQCNYAWGVVDSICYDLEECKSIYVVKDNIWGAEAVDLYGLGN